MPIPVSRSCIVSLRGLGVTLTGAAGAVEVLRGIDLDLAPGETVSVVGPSGAGKTTLLMIIGGLERPSAGQVTVAGHDLRVLDEDALARFRGRHVGIVFQSFHLIPTMTALENVAAPRELAGEPDAFERAREGAGRGGPRSPVGALSRRIVRRRAAAGGDRPRAGQPAGPPARGRTHREPRRRDRRPGDRPSLRSQPRQGRDPGADHPRNTAGRALRPDHPHRGRTHREKDGGASRTAGPR